MTKSIAIGPKPNLLGAEVFEVKRFRDAERRDVPAHAHQQGQFTCILSGVMSHENTAGLWVVPKERLVWIPPGTVHAGRSKGPVEGWLVLAPARYARQLPSRVCVLRTSALLLATLERLTRLADPNGKTAAILSQVILLELEQAEPEGLEIPLPRSPRLRALAEQLLDQPVDGRGIDAWARMTSLSRRTFTRHFAQETGLSFSQWRRRVMARRAIDLLSAGDSVSSIALALGYESVSAFIAMFKRLHGAPPAKFLAGRG
jgi:AraC-like DNA-binding protein